MKGPPKRPNRVYPVVKNQEYDRVYEWRIDRIEVSRLVSGDGAGLWAVLRPGIAFDALKF
jgi:hypothetical protein